MNAGLTLLRNIGIVLAIACLWAALEARCGIAPAPPEAGERRGQG